MKLKDLMRMADRVDIRKYIHLKAGLSDRIRLAGRIDVIKYDALTGEEIHRQQSWNTVLLQGRQWNLLHMLTAEPEASEYIDYLGVGTGGTAPTIDDTGLETELLRVGGARVIKDKTGLNASPPPPYLQFSVLFDSDEANGTLQEAGLFWADAGDETCLCRGTYASEVKTSANTLRVIYTLYG